MQRVATEQSAAPAMLTPSKNWSARAIAAFIVLAAFWFVLCRALSGEWSVNEQYNYGWFVPFFALYLFWLCWQDRPAPFPPRKTFLAWIFIGVPALLLLFPIRLFEIGNPEWRPLGWIHTASVAALTLLYIWSVGGLPWLRHFAFPIAFFFVAVPWVTPIEVPIIQGLMRAVAAVAAETVTLFGIPAQLEGNLIRVTNGLVGVNEACSGVRSLQTALMIGLLFGELKRLAISRRAALVAGATAIALMANFSRAIFLVWIAATQNIAQVSRWHELAGYAIVGLVFVGSMGLAYLLGKSELRNTKYEVADQLPQSARSSPATAGNPQSAIAGYYIVFALCWIAAVELGAHFWYRAHESNLVTTAGWSVQWPMAAPNFRELKINEEVRRQLRFDQGHAASWTLPAAKSPGGTIASKPSAVTCLLYLFRWHPGRNSAQLANLHRPDVCLPATGWIQLADNGVRNYPVTGSFALPFRHFEFQHVTLENSAPQIAHAFYCLSEDRMPAAAAADSKLSQTASAHSAWTRDERIRQVLEGRRHLGQQVMEVVFVSSEPMSAAAAEASLADLIPNLVLLRPAY